MVVSETKPDGRHLRVERNRSKIIQAMLELIRETGEVPTADVIAERAEVSRRSVFRLFEDRASLLRSTFEHMYTRVVEQYPFPDLTELEPRDKLRGLIGYLGWIYERVTPFRRISETLAGDCDVLQAERDRFQTVFGVDMRNTFRDIFPGVTASSEIIRDSLMTAMSWSAWHFLRTERGRSIEHTKAVMLHSVSTLLVAAGASL